MKFLFLFVIIVVFNSCSSKDEQFCKCLKSGEELNNFSKTLFDKEITPAIKIKMKALRKATKSACKNYTKMGKEKMLELKEACN